MQNEVIHHSISMMGMFQDSDIFMKILILGLLFASLWCWAIIFDKVFQLRRIREGMKNFEERFWHATSLPAFFSGLPKKSKEPLTQIFINTYTEYQHILSEKKSNLSIKLEERLEKVMQITIDRFAEKLETRLLFLASTGSVAPLLGLFGTVWGIMDAFNGIGATQSTNIAAVAPGVAEALFTTAVGLIAAIPAVIAYNKLRHDIDRIIGRMETFADELSTILSTHKGE